MSAEDQNQGNNEPQVGDIVTEGLNEEDVKAAEQAQADIDETKKIIEMRDKLTEPVQLVTPEPSAEDIVADEILSLQYRNEALALIKTVQDLAPKHANLARLGGRTGVASAFDAIKTHADHLAKKIQGVDYWKRAGN